VKLEAGYDEGICVHFRSSLCVVYVIMVLISQGMICALFLNTRSGAHLRDDLD